MTYNRAFSSRKTEGIVGESTSAAELSETLTSYTPSDKCVGSSVWPSSWAPIIACATSDSVDWDQASGDSSAHAPTGHKPAAKAMADTVLTAFPVTPAFPIRISQTSIRIAVSNGF